MFRSVQIICIGVALMSTTVIAAAQEKSGNQSSPQANPLTANSKRFYGGIKWMFLQSAEKMPQEHYEFRPTPDVRSFSEILTHVAESQYNFCSLASGKKIEGRKLESGSSKAELIALLKDAFGYCDKVYESLTDAAGVQMTRFHGKDTPILGVLAANQNHNLLHYGNLIVYMRLKGVVPPTSEQTSKDLPKNR
jgi:uncharacterized damage-inducible protein DinB